MICIDYPNLILYLSKSTGTVGNDEDLAIESILEDPYDTNGENSTTESSVTCIDDTGADCSTGSRRLAVVGSAITIPSNQLAAGRVITIRVTVTRITGEGEAQVTRTAFAEERYTVIPGSAVKMNYLKTTQRYNK